MWIEQDIHETFARSAKSRGTGRRRCFAEPGMARAKHPSIFHGSIDHIMRYGILPLFHKGLTSPRIGKRKILEKLGQDPPRLGSIATR